MKKISGLIVFSALIACANQPTTHTPKLSHVLSDITGQNGRACIRTNDIQGYAVSGNSININTRRKYYVATTIYRCNNLQTAPRAAFSSRFTELCGLTGEVLVPGERCRIDKIFEFENRKAAHAALTEAETTLEQLKTAATE